MNSIQQKGNILFLALITMIIISILSIGLYKIIESRHQRFLMEILAEKATNFTRSAIERSLTKLYHGQSSEQQCTKLSNQPLKIEIEKLLTDSKVLEGFSFCDIASLTCATKEIQNKPDSKYHELNVQGTCSASDCQSEQGRCVRSSKSIRVITKFTLLPEGDS
jgi:hypothetical protein